MRRPSNSVKIQVEHTSRRRIKCKIEGCKIRGRYNYGIECFYYGFCKKHYSQYQEGMIDINGNKIRPSYRGCSNITNKYPLRKKYVRWRKTDHVKNNLKCKVGRCERKGELDRGKMRFPKGFCSYHYRGWYLKGFMSIKGIVIKGVSGVDRGKSDKQLIKLVVSRMKNKI